MEVPSHALQQWARELTEGGKGGKRDAARTLGRSGALVGRVPMIHARPCITQLALFFRHERIACKPRDASKVGVVGVCCASAPCARRALLRLARRAYPGANPHRHCPRLVE